MKINNLLWCIVKELNAFGFSSVSCIPQQDNTVVLKSIVQDKSIWVTAKSKEVVDGVTMPFVISQLGMLTSMMNFEPYREATITEGTPMQCDDPYTGGKVKSNSAFNFINGATKAHIRLAPLSHGGKVPETLDPKTDFIEFVPAQASIKNLSTTSSIFAQVDTHVRPVVENGVLIFQFGAENTSNHCARQPFAETTFQNISLAYTFPVKMINAALSIPEATNTVRIIPTGVMVIVAETEHFSYKFVIPGRNS